MKLPKLNRKLVISLAGSGAIVVAGLGLFATQGGSTHKPPHQAMAVPAANGGITLEAPVLPNQVWDDDLFEKTNAERRKAGVPDLTNDAALAAVAHSRAEEMASGHYLAHTSPTGETAVTALAAAHYGTVMNAENLARVDKGETTADTMKGFMNSPRHHDTILDKQFQAMGLDSIVGDDGLRYLVVLFAGQSPNATQPDQPSNGSGPPAAPIEAAPPAPTDQPPVALPPSQPAP